jgi:hypothetical protein
MITSRELLLQHLTTWIQCKNDPSKRETAGRIEQQWQAEYRAFLIPGDPYHLHPDGLALLVALSFPYNAFMITKHGKLKNAHGFSSVHDKKVSRHQTQRKKSYFPSILGGINTR